MCGELPTLVGLVIIFTGYFVFSLENNRWEEMKRWLHVFSPLLYYLNDFYTESSPDFRRENISKKNYCAVVN